MPDDDPEVKDVVEETPEIEMPKANSPWVMYRAMVGVGIGCALLIVSVYQFTLPIIKQNQVEALDKAVFEVLPKATSKYAYTERDGKLVPAEETDPEKIYAAFDEAGAFAGVAIEAQGMGYQDTIYTLYGYDPEKQAIIGFKVLRSLETPGLGDAIGKDPVFLKNFEALDVTVDDGGKIANPIVAVKAGEKANAWEVDGISGATVSSVAVAKILKESSEKWAGLIRTNRADLKPLEVSSGE